LLYLWWGGQGQGDPRPQHVSLYSHRWTSSSKLCRPFLQALQALSNSHSSNSHSSLIFCLLYSRYYYYSIEASDKYLSASYCRVSVDYRTTNPLLMRPTNRVFKIIPVIVFHDESQQTIHGISFRGQH
jgi:hypothetical protein